MILKVLAFSGQIKSGKTTVSRAVAEFLGCGRASFGDQVRATVLKKGLATTRENLQEVGEYLIASHLEDFCHDVLAQVGESEGSHLVVDGIRHLEALECLRKLTAPRRLHLVYVDTDDTIRERRHLENSPIDLPLDAYETHSTERQVQSIIRTHADLVVNGSRDLKSAVQQIVAAFRLRTDA